MFKQTGILTFISVVVTLVLTNFPASSQTVQEGSQDASIQGDNNEINQIINQYYFNNPGQGQIKKKENNNRLHKDNNSSHKTNSQPKKTNNRQGGKVQGNKPNRSGKK